MTHTDRAKPKPRVRVLVVDDDDTFRQRLVRALHERGLDARGAVDGGQALQIAEQWRPQRAVLDLRMPGDNGLVTLGRLREVLPGLCAVVLTGYGSIATATEAIRLGAVEYLTKPTDADELLAAFDRHAGQAVPEPVEAPSLARVEWEHIQRVLADCQGNVSKAARTLGVHRRSLQRKLNKKPPAR